MNTSTGVSETLADIIGVAVEYDLHLDPTNFINYLDLYSRFLLIQRDSNQDIAGEAENFYQFISNQLLLDLTASAIEVELGEPTAAPVALQTGDTDAAVSCSVTPIGVSRTTI